MTLSRIAVSEPAGRHDPGAQFGKGSRWLLVACCIGLAIGVALHGIDASAVREGAGGIFMTVALFRDQDTVWFAVCVAFSLYLCWSLSRQAGGHLPPRLAAFWPDDPRVARYACAITLLVLAFVGTGTYLFHHAHDVVVDEFLATLQSEIFLSGQFLASYPEEWGELSRGLFPQFLYKDSDHHLWGSIYRPVHAAIRAAFSLISLGPLTNAILTALSALLIVGVARRLWPGRRDAAVLAAILLATGPQFLFTGMSGFAWPAHLCLNLLWLWLYLRDDRPGHALAALVGFAAVGLHQINPHPLFVLPFMLALLRSRRWWLAGFYACTYSAAVLTWTFWHEIATFLTVGPLTAGSEPNAGATYVGDALYRLRPYQLLLEPLMVFNLLRLLAWQNIMILPLLFVALRPWRASPPVIRLLAWGCILSMIPYVLIMPNQFYAWGYRYAHGLLGSLALIAVHGWIVLSARGEPVLAVAKRAIIGFTALTLAVGLPLRAIQMDGLVRPLAEANRYIHSLPTEVVLVDAWNIWLRNEVVRNDPFLTNRPLVLSLLRLTPEQLLQVCARYSVTLIDHEDLAPFGVIIADRHKAFRGHDESLHDLAASPACRSS